MEPKVLAATRSQVECELAEHLPLRLIGAKGRRVQCQSGMAWITAYGHSADVFLRPGEVFVIPNDGLALAEAVGQCTIRVDMPRGFDYATYRARLPSAALRALRMLRGLPMALVKGKSAASF